MSNLTHVTCRGFKSIAKLEQFSLGPLNVFIGPNGSGKSNFLDLFRMLASMPNRQLQLFVAKEDGPDALLFKGREATTELQVELNLANAAYSANLTATGEHLVFMREEAGQSWLGSGHYESELTSSSKTESDPYARMLQESMSEWRVYHFINTTTNSSIRQLQPVRDNLSLHPDGSNIAPYLRMLNENHDENYQMIVRTVRQASPYFHDFVYRDDPREHVDLEWFGRDFDRKRPYGPRQISDGTLRFICLSTLLLQPSHLQPNLILIDEPEIGLHPYALKLLAEMLRRAAASRQVLVATQSADLLNEIDPSEIVTVTRRDDASHFERPDLDALNHWLDDYTLGDLWRMKVLGTSPPK